MECMEIPSTDNSLKLFIPKLHGNNPKTYKSNYFFTTWNNPTKTFHEIQQITQAVKMIG